MKPTKMIDIASSTVGNGCSFSSRKKRRTVSTASANTAFTSDHIVDDSPVGRVDDLAVP